MGFPALMGYKYMDIGMATVCHFFYPVAVTIMMFLFFHEKLTGKRIVSVAMTCAALLMLFFSSGTASLFGICLALGSGIVWGMYLIALDRASYRTLPDGVSVVYVLGIMGVLFLLVSVLSWKYVVPGRIQVLELLLGAAGIAAGEYLTVRSIHLIGPTIAAFICLFEPVTCLITDFLVYHTVPSVIQLIAYSLMIGAIIITSS